MTVLCSTRPAKSVASARELNSSRSNIGDILPSRALLGRMSPIFDLELFSSRAEATDFAGLVEHSTVIRLAQLPGDEVKNSVAEFFLMALHNYLIRQPQSQIGRAS